MVLTKVILCFLKPRFHALLEEVYLSICGYFRTVRFSSLTNHETSNNTCPNQNTSSSLYAFPVMMTISFIYGQTFAQNIRAIKCRTTFICEQNFREIELHGFFFPFQTHLHMYFCQSSICHWSQKTIASTAAPGLLKSAPLVRLGLLTVSRSIRYKERRE